MNESVTQLRDTTGNPAPLGLLGFGMTTVLLNLHNAGFYELNSMILAMGICYGGAAQIVAGIMEWRKGNTFATTAFLSYGLFWLSLVTLIILAKLGWATPSNDTAMAAYLSDVGLVHRRHVCWHIANARRRAGRFRLSLRFFSFCSRSVILSAPVRTLSISQATKESFAVSRRSTPGLHKCSTKFSARSSCHSGR